MFGLDRIQAMVALLTRSFASFGHECDDMDAFAAAERQGPAAFADMFGAHMEKLEHLCCARDQVPLFTPLAGEMMCRAVINCPDLRAVLERSGRFSAIVAGQEHSSKLMEEGDLVRFEFVSRYTTKDEASLLNDIVGLLYHLSLMSWLTGETLEPESIALAYPRPPRSSPLFRIFDGALTFDDPRNTLLFSKATLAKPVIRRAEEIDGIIEHLPYNVILAAIGNRGMAARVRSFMTSVLRQGQPFPSESAVSHAFAMSAATLRRRLRQEGVSYRALRMLLLHEEAERLMQDRALTLSSVAQRLGFSDDRAFRRAFKAWTGNSPSALPVRTA